jgi:hypothetical protein
MTSTGLAWYINGYLIPELWMRRGLTYAFKVYGGNNPHSAETYHPFIITDESHGGFDRLNEEAQRKVRVLAGVEFTRRGQPRPTAGKQLQNIKCITYICCQNYISKSKCLGLTYYLAQDVYNNLHPFFSIT